MILILAALATQAARPCSITDRHDAPLGIELQDRLLHALLERLGPAKEMRA